MKATSPLTLPWTELAHLLATVRSVVKLRLLAWYHHCILLSGYLFRAAHGPLILDLCVLVRMLTRASASEHSHVVYILQGPCHHVNMHWANFAAIWPD